MMLCRRLLQADGGAPFRRVAQQRHDAFMAQSLVLAQAEAGEQLRVRIVMPAVLAGVQGQSPAAQLMGGQEHLPW